ncbi:MAG: HTH-type transcriptional activator IlvY [Gammaproteobacteria bacterium]|nr:HTH-type transcriptional activator IlvY [Gammaproteobacteria bacterium]
MDVRQLRQFVHLAGALHFGRASAAANVSPSALSRSIRQLEGEVGAVLFDRDNRSVTLTRQGETFLAWARDVLAGWDVVRHTVQEQSGDLQGEVSLYCSVTASYSFLFELLGKLRRDHPRIELKLHTGDPEHAIARVMAGSEDIAIGARPDALPAGLAFRPITRSRLVFIAPAGDPMLRDRGRRRREPREWAATPMILPETGLARQRADRWFRELGVKPRIYAQVAGNEAIVSMVSLGFGVGVVPEIVLNASPLADQVTMLRVTPALAPYEVGLFTLEKKLRSPLVRAFWAGKLLTS